MNQGWMSTEKNWNQWINFVKDFRHRLMFILHRKVMYRFRVEKKDHFIVPFPFASIITEIALTLYIYIYIYVARSVQYYAPSSG